VIARRFTLGQLALLAWQLREFHRAGEANDAEANHVDLRLLTGDDLRAHLARLQM
jgi:hypothetical protein